MIKLQDLTPAVYYEKSRDFQFIGRLYDIVLNYIKTNADTLYALPAGNNINDRLLNLLALTLGFQARHNYNVIQLRAICSVLPHILRNKGSVNAVLIATNALLYAEGIRQALDYSINSKNSITLYLPEELSNLSLLKDLLTYILPAGISCNLVREVSERTEITTEISTWDEISIYADTNTNPAILGRLARVSDKTVKAALNEANAKAKPGVFVNASILNSTDIAVMNSLDQSGENEDADPAATKNYSDVETEEETSENSGENDEQGGGN